MTEVKEKQAVNAYTWGCGLFAAVCSYDVHGPFNWLTFLRLGLSCTV
jgi:hypothetical protein